MVNLLEKPEIRKGVTPLSVYQYHGLIEQGLIQDNLELLEGILFEKMSKSPLHVYLLNIITTYFRNKIPHTFLIRNEQPITTQNSEPEPDLAIVAGKDEDYIFSHPKTAELIIEVALSSLALDLEKAEIYARANIPEFIIIDGGRKQIFYFAKPASGKYQEENTIAFDKEIILACFPELSFSLADFWPKEKI